MTTVFRDDKTCPVCGSKVKVNVVGSTNTFGGGPDLDTRPAEMMRSTINYWIEVCLKCGYVSGNLNEKTSITKAFLSTDGYMTCDGIPFKGDLQKNFYRAYLIAKEEKEDRKRMLSSLLNAAWACDDDEDESANEVRKLLIREIDESNIIEENDAWEIIRADLLRRTGQFAKLRENYSEKQYDQNIYNSIIQYQLLLADSENREVHTMDDMNAYNANKSNKVIEKALKAVNYR